MPSELVRVPVKRDVHTMIEGPGLVPMNGGAEARRSDDRTTSRSTLNGGTVNLPNDTDARGPIAHVRWLE